MIVNDKVVNKIVEGQAFGEISLIHNSARTASIKTLSEKAALWGVQRQVFRSAAATTAAAAADSISCSSSSRQHQLQLLLLQLMLY